MSQAERLSGGDLWEKPTKPDEDLRLLAKKPGFQRDDYVDFPGRAAYEEPEAIDKARLQDLADANNANFAALHAEEKRLREAQRYGAQVKDLFLRALHAGVDLPDEARRLEEIIESGKQKLRAAA